MTRTKAVIAVSFALVFAAGLAVGRLTGGRDPDRPDRSWLTRELDLSPEQQEQMRQIWSEAMARTRGGDERHPGEFYEQRRQAIRELLTEEQLKRYEGINAEFERKRRELREERREAFEEAIARTKEILSEQQRSKYERLLERMRRHRGERRGERRDGRRGDLRGPPGLPPAEPPDRGGEGQREPHPSP